MKSEGRTARRHGPPRGPSAHAAAGRSRSSMGDNTKVTNHMFCRLSLGHNERFNSFVLAKGGGGGVSHLQVPSLATACPTQNHHQTSPLLLRRVYGSRGAGPRWRRRVARTASRRTSRAIVGIVVLLFHPSRPCSPPSGVALEVYV